MKTFDANHAHERNKAFEETPQSDRPKDEEGPVDHIHILNTVGRPLKVARDSEVEAGQVQVTQSTSLKPRQYGEGESDKWRQQDSYYKRR